MCESVFKEGSRF